MGSSLSAGWPLPLRGSGKTDRQRGECGGGAGRRAFGWRARASSGEGELLHAGRPTQMEGLVQNIKMKP